MITFLCPVGGIDEGTWNTWRYSACTTSKKE